MTSSNNLSAVCTGIAREAAEDHGFVALSELLKLFKAELFFRPLLVEAAIAKHPATPGHWAILVDSERYGPTSEPEAIGRPWDARLRFTVAHELAHSVAFRPSEFGFEFKPTKRSKQAAEDFVSVIERETDRATSHLLLPGRALEFLPEGGSATDLRSFCRQYGVSSFVLLSRLARLNTVIDQHILARLPNTAVGLVRGKEFTPFPLFSNFDRNIAPKLIRDLEKDRPVRLSDLPVPLADGEATFAMRGGTQMSPEAEEMNLQLTIETGSDARIFVICSTDKRPQQDLFQLS